MTECVTFAKMELTGEQFGELHKRFSDRCSVPNCTYNDCCKILHKIGPTCSNIFVIICCQLPLTLYEYDVFISFLLPFYCTEGDTVTSL